MRNKSHKRASLAVATVTSLALTSLGTSFLTPVAMAQSSQPANIITLSKGRGQVVNLPGTMSDLFVADSSVADVQVRSSRQLYVFGKGNGETTVYATARDGKVLYSATVHVGQNFNSVSQMLKLAMPEAAIEATPMNGIVLLTGTVSSPDDIEQAHELAQAFVGKEIQVVSRLKTATPMQVNLRVKIAEVSRELAREVGFNLLSRDTTGGFLFGIAQGRKIGTIGNQDLSGFPKLDASSVFGLPTGSLQLPFNPSTGQFIAQAGTTYDLSSLGVDGKTAIAAAGRVAGLDLAGVIDLAENDGSVVTLAEPNLTALSGETASFLAGGEIPIPISQGLGQISVEYKQYGVSLAFTPAVLSDGRISLRVRPEVSQLSSAGAISLNGFQIPGITTRRAETTVELGSGQSFMIGGLLGNTTNNSIDKAPFLGDLPILGNLFRSKNFRRNETELVIVVTPYLVRPVSENQIALPTDGYKAPTDFQQHVLGHGFDGKSEPGSHPKPAKPNPEQPSVSSMAPALPARSSKSRDKAAAAEPGFSFN